MTYMSEYETFISLQKERKKRKFEPPEDFTLNYRGTATKEDIEESKISEDRISIEELRRLDRINALERQKLATRGIGCSNWYMKKVLDECFRED